MTGCTAAALALGSGLTALAGAASTTSAPVIHESFTVLPCPSKPRTTVQIEGCAEHKVLETDQEIDARNATIFTKLGKSGRAAFIKTNTAWVTYRNEACTTEASIYSGGSIQPVAYANCLVSIDRSHVTELKAMQTALSPGD
jgi:uncharacterized protein YecT (DUF1311 family)